MGVVSASLWRSARGSTRLPVRRRDILLFLTNLDKPVKPLLKRPIRLTSLEPRRIERDPNRAILGLTSLVNIQGRQRVCLDCPVFRGGRNDALLDRRLCCCSCHVFLSAPG